MKIKLSLLLVIGSCVAALAQFTTNPPDARPISGTNVPAIASPTTPLYYGVYTDTNGNVIWPLNFQGSGGPTSGVPAVTVTNIANVLAAAAIKGANLATNGAPFNGPLTNTPYVKFADGTVMTTAASGGNANAVTNGGAATLTTVTATTLSGAGSGITTLSASAISSGTVAPARLGTGTANSSTYLRGDSTYGTPSGGVTLPNTANIIGGDGSGGAVDSGIAKGSIVTNNATGVSVAGTFIATTFSITNATTMPAAIANQMILVNSNNTFYSVTSTGTNLVGVGVGSAITNNSTGQSIVNLSLADPTYGTLVLQKNGGVGPSIDTFGANLRLFTTNINGHIYFYGPPSAPIADFATNSIKLFTPTTASQGITTPYNVATTVNASGNNGYYPNGANWTAITKPPVILYYGPFPPTYGNPSQLTNQNQILIETTNMAALGTFQAHTNNGSNLYIWVDSGSATMSAAGLNWNTNIFPNMTNFCTLAHSLGYKVAVSVYFNGDLHNLTLSTGCFVTDYNAHLAPFYVTYASMGNINTYFGSPPGLGNGYLEPIMTPEEVPGYVWNYCCAGVDTIVLNDMSMTIAGFKTIENSVAYNALYPSPNATTPGGVSYYSFFTNRTAPLGIITYETVSSASGYSSLADTYTTRNGIVFDQGPDVKWGTNTTYYSLHAFRSIHAQYPGITKTSQGSYFSVVMSSKVDDDLTAIASWSPYTYAGSISNLNFQFTTNANWARVANDSDQNFPTFIVDNGPDKGCVLGKKQADGSKALGFFNDSPATNNLTVTWSQLGIQSNAYVNVSCYGVPLGTYVNSFSTNLPPSTNLVAGSSCLLTFSTMGGLTTFNSGLASVSAISVPAMTVNGVTNTSAASMTIYGFTGTTVTLKQADLSGVSLGTITTGTTIILQPGGSVVGTSCAAVGVHSF